MSKISKAYRLLPILHVTGNLNSRRTLQLIKKIQNICSVDTIAVGIIVDVKNSRAVQVDKILQSLNRIRKQKQVPIYGFTNSKISPQSYYLLSNSNKIYSSPTSIFVFQRPILALKTKSILKQSFKIQKIIALTKGGIFGKFSDIFQTLNITYQSNNQYIQMYKRLLRYSLKNRRQLHPNLLIKQQQIKPYMLGQDLKQNNLIDGYGHYQQILRKQFPQGKLYKINYSNEGKKIMQSVIFITSPILMLLFFFKVVLKWSLIFYGWMKAKAMRATGMDITEEDMQADQVIVQENGHNPENNGNNGNNGNSGNSGSKHKQNHHNGHSNQVHLSKI